MSDDYKKDYVLTYKNLAGLFISVYGSIKVFHIIFLMLCNLINENFYRL